MIPKVGDWLYFPTDSWKAIHKILGWVTSPDGTDGFMIDINYLRPEQLPDARRFVEPSHLNPANMDGIMIVASTDEEKRFMELMLR